jgi:hypothetical protein
MENWNYASDASKGVIARRYPYNYQMGMGFEHTREDWPGIISEGISEQNQRGFYKRWARIARPAQARRTSRFARRANIPPRPPIFSPLPCPHGDTIERAGQAS